MRIITISCEFGSGDGSAYHLTVNTEGWDMEELESALAGFILRWYGR